MNTIKKNKWVLLGLLTMILNGLFGRFPVLTEKLYFKGFFQIIRVIYDYSIGFLPFPPVYLLAFGILWFVYIRRQKIYKSVSNCNTLLGLKEMFLAILNIAGIIIFFFYFMWGFNYQRFPLAKHLDFTPKTVDTLELKKQVEDVLAILTEKRLLISQDSLTPLIQLNVPDEMESDIRFNLENSLASWGFPTHGRVRVRKLTPRGLLMRISTAGVYIPFVCEGHIDKGLHPIQWPFTMAHEMSHGYGFADEGTCNFIGFVTCIRSEDPFIQYSALLSFWRYAYSNLRKMAPHSYKLLSSEIPQAVKTDLKAIYEYSDRYPDILPQLRDIIYDSYLKSHGVKGGLGNYSTVVRLVLQWKESGKDKELVRRITR